MNRRDFLQSAGMMCATVALGDTRLFSEETPQPEWRTFEVTTHVEVLKPSGVTRIWVPAALIRDTPFQKTYSNRYVAEGARAKLSQSRSEALGIITATFPSGVKPALTLTSRVAVRDYGVDLFSPDNSRRADNGEFALFTRPTKLLPTDGIVKETALRITQGATNDKDKARAIYEWIVDNTHRDPVVRGCGRGDIRAMLETGDLGGKCADLNALYVGLARSVGLPARDVYGIRVAASHLGYKCLGASSENVTKSQHCRAEVFLTGYGWVPVDPADVRKVVLEEPPGNRLLTDDMVASARNRLFGSWEMNWMAYNFSHDVVLPGSNGAPIAFFMYPQAETEQGRLDSLDPDNFKYEITAKKIPS